MRLSRVLLLIGILAFAPVLASATEYFVSIPGFEFSPQDLTISVGDVVTWTNDHSVTHTSTSDDGGATWDSGDLLPGESFSFTFDNVGAFPYHCTRHPSMTGTITVEEVQEVPTLSQWGMLIMSLLLVGTGTVAVIRRRSLQAARQK
jgi:plastocyanin